MAGGASGAIEVLNFEWKARSGLLRHRLAIVCRVHLLRFVGLRLWVHRHPVDDRFGMIAGKPFTGGDETHGEADDRAITLEVTGRSLLSELVAGILPILQPRVAVVRVDGDDLTGVRVSLGGTGRWLFIAGGDARDHHMAAAVAAGASAVAHIGSDRSELEDALAALLNGGPQLVPASLTPVGPGSARVRLTQREYEILSLVATGLSNREIAASLTISINTVRTHLRATAVKLGASSRGKIIANARSLGLLGGQAPYGALRKQSA